MSIAMYSFIQLSKLEQCRVKKKNCPRFDPAAQDLNLSSLSLESYVLVTAGSFHVKSITQNITQLQFGLNLLHLLTHARLKKKYWSRYTSLNFDPICLLNDTLLPVTLLLIKLQKQLIYNWKANKHAHITYKIKTIV